jgi:hypothetical protein
MPSDLRNSLWNVLDEHVFSVEGFYYLHGDSSRAFLRVLARHIWDTLLKQPVDQIPDTPAKTMAQLRTAYFAADWPGVYEFIEEVLKVGQGRYTTRLQRGLNHALTRELAAYRVVDGEFVPITSEQDLAAVAEARSDGRFASVSAHLAAAQSLLSDRRNPDFRNSIKESISAVEAMAQTVTGNSKATLGDALKVLESKHGLHPALSKGFDRLYGYSSNADGIRHAMSDVPGLTLADAKFFLVSCSSFINYLKAKT